MYLYELPTTGAISFSDFCIDQSTNKAYTAFIPQSTQARANVRGTLKESKRTGHEQKDFLQLVKVRFYHLRVLFSINLPSRMCGSLHTLQVADRRICPPRARDNELPGARRDRG